MTIADIAYQHLDPNVRSKVDNLTGFFQKEYSDVGSFQEMASWPDALRSQKIELFTHWHYIDVSFSNDGTPVKNKMDTDNAVWAVNNIVPVIRNNKANPYERARFLGFLVHIVGDLHQPLHNVTYFSAAHPDGDKGGNLYLIRYRDGSVETISAHKLWDEGVGSFSASPTSENADKLANEIMALYPESFFDQRADDLNLDHWTQEGLSNAKNYVYDTPENQPPVSGYLEQGQKIAEQQVALAGYRLARLLNQLLGESK